MGHLLEDPQRRTGGGHDVHGRRADHVGETVRIGEHGGGPAWHHESGQLAGGEQGVLDVQVDVDERRRHEAAGCIDLPLGPQATRRGQRGDVGAHDHHVALDQLAVVHRQDRAPPNDEIGRAVAPGDALEDEDLLRSGDELGAEVEVMRIHVHPAITTSSTSRPRVPSTRPRSVTWGPVRQARFITITENSGWVRGPGGKPMAIAASCTAR